MAWSYRKRIKIAPGISINLSKSGISTSIGPKGAKVTVGPKGTYLHTGIPGTGIYSRQKIGSSSSSSKPSYTAGLLDTGPSASRSRTSYTEGFGVDMKMDRKGNLTFSFTDSRGYPITDDATVQRLIRKTKSLPFYKEKLAEVTRMTFEEVNADTEAFTELYKNTPALKTESEVNMALTRVTQKYYTPLPYTEEAPDKNEIERQLQSEAEEKIHHFFWWKNKPERAKYVVENLPVVYDQQVTEWERRRDVFNANQAREKKFKDAEYLHEYLEERKTLEDTFPATLR